MRMLIRLCSMVESVKIVVFVFMSNMFMCYMISQHETQQRTSVHAVVQRTARDDETKGSRSSLDWEV